MIRSIDFFSAWLHAVNAHRAELKKIWRKRSSFTNFIKGDNNTILKQVSVTLGLSCYPKDYYSMDAVFYNKEDRVPETPENSYWFHDIHIAFEHENEFNRNLYQEVAHLLLLNAQLHVLVTYPDGGLDYTPTIEIMEYLHRIISTNRQSTAISENENFLVIFGYEADMVWEGYVYKKNGWKQIG
jgi:hypothetical protein